MGKKGCYNTGKTKIRASKVITNDEKRGECNWSVRDDSDLSIPKHASVLNVHGPSLRKDLTLHPYKIQLVLQLHFQNATQRFEFLNEAIESFSTCVNILSTDEAHFYCRYWCVKNPKRKLLHSLIPAIWAAISVQEMNGPYFFEDVMLCALPVNSVCYIKMLDRFTSWCLNCKTYLNISKEDGMFNANPGKLISRRGEINWTSRSRMDLCTCGIISNLKFFPNPWHI